MNDSAPAIHIENLSYSYGKAEAVHDLSLTVRPGRCYGLFGRNGAGKTTTMKCLLNLLHPKSGQIRVFGIDPSKKEVEVKKRLAFVPDQIAFYPWMSVRETLDYFASFRENWNRKIELDLLDRFRLDPSQRASSLSRGQRTQVALIAAVCPETDLLVLDEPTSGLDPIVRREFIETVIGAYQDTHPDRTIFVSTHLISEFEGLIDEFTIMDAGRAVLTLPADEARDRYRKIRARFATTAPDLKLDGAISVRTVGRELEIIANGAMPAIEQRLRAENPEELSSESLTLEEIFVATLNPGSSK
ncbi:MAG: ABC transporter ATP-binding protein [Acidobacteria bacterium]|nr:ABC transporter ATP-binding protein [Acidobacteriota bacterium]MBS1867548.1 ABC transporter ATP-binding protein [Acidobacteriota bacterium]